MRKVDAAFYTRKNRQTADPEEIPPLVKMIRKSIQLLIVSDTGLQSLDSDGNEIKIQLLGQISS